MNLIDRYTARNVLAAMLVVQVLLMGLDLVINYISGLDDVENHYGAFEVLLYTLMRLPWRFYQYAPVGVLLGGLIGLVGCEFDFRVSLHDLSLFFLWGAVIVTIVHYFFTLGSRYITGAEIMLITLIEFTLGPIWVWLVFGEQPTRIALIGGLIVLSAVAARALLMMYEDRSTRHLSATRLP